MEICRKRSSVKGPRNCRHRARRQKANVLMPNSFSCRNRRNKNPLFKMKQYERFAQRTLRSLSLFASSLLMYERQMKYPKRMHMRTRNAPTMMQNSAKTASTSIIFFTGAESIIKRDNNNTHTDGADHGADTPGPSLSIYTLLWSNGFKCNHSCK